MEEIWKDIEGYEGLYQVSNTGKVRSLHWNRSSYAKELTQYDQNGYKLVTIRRNKRGKNFLVHRLVAKAFIENPNGYDEVNHIDGNKSNNCVMNLEWLSRKNNVSHAIANRLRKPTVANRWGFNVILQFSADGSVLEGVYKSQRGAAEKCNLSQAQISLACKTGKTYAGYRWRIALH